MNYTNLSHVIALVLFHGIAGFGPGFMIGLALGNYFAVRDEKTIMNKQEHAISTASKHNRQWHPSHERWQSK